jgi:hypothetical protein
VTDDQIPATRRADRQMTKAEALARLTAVRKEMAALTVVPWTSDEMLKLRAEHKALIHVLYGPQAGAQS